MKVTRSYWLGLGSGLILSAMLTLVVSSQHGQAVIPQEPSSSTPVEKQETTESLPTTQTSITTEPSQVQPPNTQKFKQIEQGFVVPKGASTERIADLLIGQGFIKDKESFLMNAHEMGVESQFKEGRFTLSLGLTTEELIGRLINLE